MGAFAPVSRMASGPGNTPNRLRLPHDRRAGHAAGGPSRRAPRGLADAFRPRRRRGWAACCLHRRNREDAVPRHRRTGRCKTNQGLRNGCAAKIIVINQRVSDLGARGVSSRASHPGRNQRELGPRAGGRIAWSALFPPAPPTRLSDLVPLGSGKQCVNIDSGREC